ncbi:MAG: hypothetical protein C5B50_30050 [Verrucomicrobia bacterium]|nr:MAG: hypothetical protein C5B50_30050 [Verrucomicrobiota bacterium]
MKHRITMNPMGLVKLRFCLGIWTILGCLSLTRGAETDGVALAIIYDTSGSMNELVPDAAGGRTPKYVIANRALLAVASHIESFLTNNSSSSPRRIEAGLFVFKGNGAREAVKFGPFDAEALKSFARDFSDPRGATPLGNALNTAGGRVLGSSLSRKHVLIITDGMNTLGPSPADVLPKLKQRAEAGQSGISVHFIAFDVDAKVFASVKKMGATVVSASNEKELNSQLEFILQKKILLEDEEPPKK